MPAKQAISFTEYCPASGVSLRSGLLFDVFRNNQEYLMRHFTLDDLAYPFRVRKGLPGKRSRPLSLFWETDLEGSNAGRFLMGAGNTLRYQDNPALRARMEQLLQEILLCSEEDGYCMGFAKEDMMILERANYTRSWLTRGLLAAADSGSQTAELLVRRFEDWFQAYPHRRKAAELHLSYQGMIADMAVAMSRCGTAKDWECSRALYADESWIDDLLHDRTETIWKRPNDGAHGYELNAMVSYFMLYVLSGEQRYRDAVLCAWSMFQQYWIHTCGSVAICEEHDAVFNYAPGSRLISADWHTGETCNNVWWILLNILLLQLDPEKELYAAEIERSLYNVLLPAQGGSEGIRYHANLHGIKDDVYAENTCCEGTGTMLYGMLPALVYRLHTGDCGLTVHLFADSELRYNKDDIQYSVRMQTDFPVNNDVRIVVESGSDAEFPLKIRMPSWMDRDVSISLNGQLIDVGRPGSYVTIQRNWQGKNEICFCLNRSLKAIRYLGFSTIRGYERYTLMDGPILMAVTGRETILDQTPAGWIEKHPLDLRSSYNRTHWILNADPRSMESFRNLEGIQLKPYYAIGPKEPFTCLPLIAEQNVTAPLSPSQLFASGLRRRIDCCGTSFELAGVPSGSFLMGQNGFEPCERPVHKVCVDHSFYMGVFPVTQAQYEAVMGHNPSRHQNTSCPVETVSYDDTSAFIDKLNANQDEVHFRLPTEEEWEYACRAGSRDISGYATDCLRDFSQYMWNYQQLGTQSVQTNAEPCTHPVGEKLQNAWGLYDMLGNVGEWCSSPYSSYEDNGFYEPNLRVIRGGSYTDLATYCRCATRNALEPEWKNRFTGFRLAADLIEKQENRDVSDH